MLCVTGREFPITHGVFYIAVIAVDVAVGM